MSIPGISLALSAAEAGALGLLQQLHGAVPRGLQWTPTDPTTGSPLLDVNGNPVVNSLTAQVTVEEIHEDELYITRHPVEQGSPISDHAYKLPPRLSLVFGWSNSPSPKNTGILYVPANIISGVAATTSLFSSTPSYVNSIYEQLVALQNSAAPVTIFTGKRRYDSMLIQRLRTETNKDTENSLIVRCDAEQIFTVTTQVVTAPPIAVQAQPKKTAATVKKGTIQPKSTSTLSATQMDNVCPAVGGDWEDLNPNPAPQGFGTTITGAL